MNLTSIRISYFKRSVSKETPSPSQELIICNKGVCLETENLIKAKTRGTTSTFTQRIAVSFGPLGGALQRCYRTEELPQSKVDWFTECESQLKEESQ